MKSDSEKFWAKVEKTAGCWIWTGDTTRGGYGRFRIRRQFDPVDCRAHRYVWELVGGPVPADLNVLHHCDNPPCVRPEHLFVGTDRDNLRDAMAKGRWRPGRNCGERNGRAKVTAEQVLEIRQRYAAGDYQRVLAGEFGLAQSKISAIVRRKNWRESTCQQD